MKTKFRTKLIAIFILVTILQGTVIGFLSYKNTKESIMHNKQQDMREQINLIDININSQVRYIESLIVNLAESDIAKSIFTDMQNLENHTLSSEYFKNFIQAIGVSSNIMLLTQEESLTYSGRDSIFSLNLFTISTQRQIYSDVAGQITNGLKWAGMADSLVENSPTPKRVLRVLCPVLFQKYGRVLGALIIEIDPATFGKLILNNHNSFQKQYTFILDKNNNIICNNKIIPEEWIPIIANNFEDGLRQFSEEFSEELYYVCGQYNGITGWKTFSVLSTGNLVYHANELASFIILCIFISTLAVCAITIVLSYTITIPIQRLSLAMQVVQSGNLDVRIHTKRKDEIGMLMNFFDYMLDKINALIREVYEEKLAQKSAEMSALEAQINPHFLYNTLDSINWMLVDKEQFEVSEIIVSLGELLKYTVDKNNSIVPLEKEIQYIVRYLQIQQNRLEDKLKYKISVPEKFNNFYVPKLILQPIVENAIIHGLLPNGGGTLTILAIETKDNLYITVSDNGRGIAQENLEKIVRNLQVDYSETDSIGIYNVNKRLQLHYGKEFALHIESALNKGTQILICVPKEACYENNYS